MTELIEILESELKENSNSQIGLKQKAYLKNQFELYGLTAAKRREIQKPFFIKEYLPEKRETKKIIPYHHRELKKTNSDLTFL